MRWAWRARPHTRGRRCWTNVASTHCARCRHGPGPRGSMRRRCRPGAHVAAKPERAWLWHRAVDAQARGSSRRTAVRRQIRPDANLAHPRGPGLFGAKARASCHRARRGCCCDLEAQDLAWAQVRAQREGRLIVFNCESGLSERPTRVRTWTPKGQTPIIQFHFNWTHISVIAGLSRINLFSSVTHSPTRSV